MYFLSQNYQTHFWCKWKLLENFWVLFGLGKIYFPPFAPRNGLTLTRWPLFATDLQNTKSKMKKQNLQKTNIPLLFGIENNGDRLWWKIFEKSNPSPPSDENWEGRRGNFWVGKDRIQLGRQNLPTTILWSTIGMGKKTIRHLRSDSQIQGGEYTTSQDVRGTWVTSSHGNCSLILFLTYQTHIESKQTCSAHKAQKNFWPILPFWAE